MKRTIKVGMYFYVKSIEEWGIFLVKSWIFVINSPKVISRKINCLLIQSLIQYFPFIPNPQIFSTKVITCLWDRRSEICHHNTKKIVLLSSWLTYNWPSRSLLLQAITQCGKNRNLLSFAKYSVKSIYIT